MKINSLCLCFGISILSFLQGFAQDTITEAWVAERYGKRFISAKEAGFENLIIPYTIQNLQFDKMSWLVPFEIDGKPQYRMIQARYLPNEVEKNDTLNVQEAVNFIKIIQKMGRNFPDNKILKFFRTRERSYDKGTECRKTIACDSVSYKVIDLPVNVSIIMKGEKTISYVSNVEGKIIISLDATEGLKNEETKGYSVMTLVSLTPTR